MSGRYFVHIVLGSNYEDTVGFKRSLKGDSARGEVLFPRISPRYTLVRSTSGTGTVWYRSSINLGITP